MVDITAGSSVYASDVKDGELLNFDGGALVVDVDGLANTMTVDGNGGRIGLSGDATFSGSIDTTGGGGAALEVEAYDGVSPILALTGADTISNGLIVDDRVTVLLGDGFSDAGTLAGNVLLSNGTLAFDHSAGTATTYGGDLSGSGTLWQIGGTTRLTGTSALNGYVLISGGILQAGSAGALSGSQAIAFGVPAPKTAAGTLDLDGFSQTVLGLTDGGDDLPGATVTNSGTDLATLTIAAGSQASFSGTLTDGANAKLALDVAGSQTLTGVSTFTGGTTIEAGGALVLAYNQPDDTGASIAAGSVSGAIVDNGTLVLAQYVTDANGNVGAAFVANDISGSGQVLVVNPNGGYSVLEGTNTYSGVTLVGSGVLIGGTVDTFSNASTVALGASGTLDLAGHDQRIGGLSDVDLGPDNPLDGAGTVFSYGGAASLYVGDNDADTSFSGTIVDDGDQTGSGYGTITLHKTGTGTLALAGANSYSGGTVIEGGTLDLRTNAAAGSGAISFTAGSAEILEYDASPSDGSLANALTGFGNGDSLDLAGLGYQPSATAALSGGTLTVTSGSATESFALTNPAFTNLSVASDGRSGTLVTAYAAPAIAGTGASQVGANAASTPFAGVTVTDPNSGVDTLTIALSGGQGTLAGTGLVANADGTYTLTGTAAQVTAALRGLVFTPATAAAGTSTATTFTLTDGSTGAFGLTATDAGTVVTNVVAPPPANTTPPGSTTPPVVTSPPTNGTSPVVTTSPTNNAPSPVVTNPPTNNSPSPTVAIGDQVSYGGGAFTLAGTASSAAGVTNVEISAVLDDGSRQDLGAATLNGDGSFTFSDRIGRHQQSFIEATLTDGAGAQTQSTDASFSLSGGLRHGAFHARQTSYTAAGDALTSTSLFRADGSRTVDVQAYGQTLTSGTFDTWKNHGAPDNTFVFNPGHGLDVVHQFRVGGDQHDTLSFSGTDFGNDLAQILRNTHNVQGGVTIVDPTTQDAVKLIGITKQQLAANRADFAFHA